MPCRERSVPPLDGGRWIWKRRQSFRCFYSSLAHDIQNVGWKEPNIHKREREKLRTEGPIWRKKSEAKGPDECQSSRATGQEERFSRHQTRRRNDLTQHQAVAAQVRMRLRAEAFYQEIILPV